jgi:hypothetical protein
MNDLQKAMVIALAENNMDETKAARETNYHRNTCVYHFGRIYEQTGLNPRCFFDLVKLYEMATGESIMEHMTTKEAIAYLQPIADNTSLSGYQAALKVAMEAMRERDNGVIRCKDCKHYEQGYCHYPDREHITDFTDFCNRGERKQ